MASKRSIFKWHSLLGLLSGLFLLLVSISGGIILFHEYLNDWSNAEQRKVEVQGTRMSIDRLADTIQAQLPNHDFNGFPDYPEAVDRALKFVVDQYDDYEIAYVNPYTGELLGAHQSKWVDWIYDFHYKLQLGLFGEWVVFILSLMLMASVVTGYIIYKKHIWDVLLFRQRYNFKNLQVGSVAIHRMMGVWGMVFHFIMGLTGFYLMLYLLLPSDDAPVAQTNNLQYTFSVDDAMQQAYSLVDDYDINYIKYPRGPQDSILSFWGDVPGSWHLAVHATSVDFNVISGELVHVQLEHELDALTQVMLLLSTLHFGHFAGIIGEIIYLLFTIATSLMAITGSIIWWKKSRKKPKRKRSA